MWKKSEVWKNKSFRFLVLVEVILLFWGCIGLVPGDRMVADMRSMQLSVEGGEYRAEEDSYYIDTTADFQGDFMQAASGALSSGVYRLELVAESEDSAANFFTVTGTSGKYGALRSNPVSIYPGQELHSCQFYVTSGGEKPVVAINYSGTGGLEVEDLRIIKTNAGSRMFLVLTLLISTLVNTLVMLYTYMGKYTVPLEKKLVWFSIPAVALVASFPVFTNYVFFGVDYIFHCMRIEALAQSICQGAIPTRIESVWLYGHGYANSIFYGDTFLALPAILKIIGFDMTFCYNSYVFAINLITALIAYISFRVIFKNRYTGIIGSVLYTLAPYRIYNIYNRSAVGEYTAMTFLPLLVMGFYLIFTEDTESRSYKHYWLIPAMGFSGILQSHVLSCEIAGVFTILLCLIMIKRIFRKKIFWELCKAAVGTVLLNAWFLVPLLDMMGAGEYYFGNNTRVTVQNRGILLANIFDTMQKSGGNSKFYDLGLLDTEPIGVGLAILFGTVAWFFARKLLNGQDDKRLDSATKVAFAVGVIGLVTSTAYFPWDTIQSWNRITGTLVPMIQFTTRLTVIPTVCLSFVACSAAAYILKNGERWLKYTFVGLMCGASIVLSLFQTNDALLNGDVPLRIYSIENIGHSAVLGAEYLPLNSELPSSYHGANASEGVSVLSFEKENLNTRTELTVEAGEEEYYVELPMLCYKGYRAKDTETGESFEVVPGNNYEVRVLLPAGYRGTLRVWYAGMWYWRLAEAVSLVCFLAIAAGWIVCHKRSRKSI